MRSILRGRTKVAQNGQNAWGRRDARRKVTAQSQHSHSHSTVTAVQSWHSHSTFTGKAQSQHIHSTGTAQAQHRRTYRHELGAPLDQKGEDVLVAVLRRVVQSTKA